jgi:hypothetical protein
MKVKTGLVLCGLIVLMLTACASTGGTGAGGAAAGDTHGGGGSGDISQDSREQPAAAGGAEPRAEEQDKPLTEKRTEERTEERTEADAVSAGAILELAMPRMDSHPVGNLIVVQTLPHPVRLYKDAGRVAASDEDGDTAAAGDAAADADTAEGPVGRDRREADNENGTAPAARGRQPRASDSTTRTASAGASSEDGFRPQTSSAQASGAQTVKEGPPTAEEQPETYNDIILAAVGETVQISLPDHRWVFDRRNSDTGEGIEFRDIQYLQSSKDFIFSAENVGEASLVFTRQDLNTGKSEKTVIRVSIREMSEKLATLQERESAEMLEEENLPPLEFSRDILQQELRESNIPGIERQLNLLNASLRSEKDKGSAGQVEWDPVIDAAGKLSGSRYEATAVESLQLYLLLDTSVRERIAEVYYLLGAMYESPPYPRDEREAVKYYRKVTDIYPTNTYYFRAEERIKYLERHFLQIR